MMTWEVDKTEAERLVTRTLRDLLTDSPYRVGALLLTYPPTEPGMDCRIAQAVMLGNVTAAHTLDGVILVRALRGLADELEKVFAGHQPLPAQPKDWSGL